jgi:hypothetical protein
LALLLSLCLGLFLTDAGVSLLDDSLLLFFGVSILSGFRVVVAMLTLLVTILVHVSMGFIPMVPKRIFLPLTLFTPVTLILLVPVTAVFFSRMQQVAWVASLVQVGVGFALLYWVQGGLKLRWPIFPERRLGNGAFSWLNLLGFAGVNLFVLLPAALVGVFLGARFSLDHLSDGFIALRPHGITVAVREYLRDDGRRILLVPMAHVGEPRFYQAVSDSFPTNALILMEGVTDDLGLLTNKVAYQRMAESLGLVEQGEEFNPSPRQVIHADVDVQEFTQETIDFLNLAMLGHARGMTPEVIKAYINNSPSPGFEEQLFDDLLDMRNQRLLLEVRNRLEEAEQIIVPWGAAHMPGIARGIAALGFRAGDAHEYVVIRFGPDSRDAN